jgi:uncharacterized protein (DUF2235 family)
VPKNILIFSDGMGQAGGLTPDENVSNIYILCRATRCGPDSDIDTSEQLTFYDPGLGSQLKSGVFGAERAYRWLHNLVSQATGLGITMNIVDCYAAILRMWQPGDRVFLFGFSRAAYTVRCVAAVLFSRKIRRPTTFDFCNHNPPNSRRSFGSSAWQRWATNGSPALPPGQRVD